MADEYFKWIATRKEIQDQTILPLAFWQAFEHGRYPPTVDDRISYHIEEFAPLLEGLGYVDSAYMYGYELNFIAIHQAFHISIFAKDKVNPLGVIDYNVGRKRHQVCIRARQIRSHPLMPILLNKMSEELERKGVETDERAINASCLVFVGSIKIMITSVRWAHLIRTAPSMTPKEKAEQIATELGIDPVSAAAYGRFSRDRTVRREATNSYNVLLDQKYAITQKWQTLIANEPELAPQKRAERIAQGLGIDPITVTGFGRFSTDPTVKYEAIKSYGIISEQKYDITQKWRDLIATAPRLTPQERAEQIAQVLGIDPITVTGCGKYSTDKTVKYEACKAHITLMDSKHEVTTKWRALITTAPHLTPQARAERIAQALGIDPITLAGYGKYSSDKTVRYEAAKAYGSCAEENHAITQQWQALIAESPELLPQERAEQIAQVLGISATTVASYGSHSSDPAIRSNARLAYTTLVAMKHGITAKWRTLIDTAPNLAPEDRAQRIALDLDINPTTAAIYGGASLDQDVKSEAIKAARILTERNHDVTGKWRRLLERKPHLTPAQRATAIAADLDLNPISVAGYGKASPDSTVKTEANRALNHLLDVKHGITQKWRELIDTAPGSTPVQRAEAIAAELGISAITVAGYERYSTDKGVRSDAYHAYCMLQEAKYDITAKWRRLIDSAPTLTPTARANRIAAELPINPTTVASYGRSSPDPEVKSEAHRAINERVKSKLK